ncbi:MAG: phosphoribosylformylglycinamidine cyclo-ligase [Actinobacteria bacterium]|nr:phosphoribosylformylglycinamidine cyclo-ligase [Actinomycetota bacterium]
MVPNRADDELSYRSAGVDILAGEDAVHLIKEDVESTYVPGVIGSLGGFAGLYEIPEGLSHPVLVTATDGVGTKILLAQETRKLDSVGIDLVAMSVNDVLTTGARPVLFLDYVAVGHLVPEDMKQIVAGVAEGCRQANCALVGGEMAEMPGLYSLGEFDVAGFCVGIGERGKLIDGSQVTEGDVVLGLTSSGFHSNGYSLLRKVLDLNDYSLDDRFPGFDETIAETLLRPTRIYVRSVRDLLDAKVPVRAMAHITGGGMIGNLSRVIPDGLCARLRFTDWRIPPMFRAVQNLGDISDEEMFKTFNMGIGFVLVIPESATDLAAARLQNSGETVIRLGEVASAAPPAAAAAASASAASGAVAEGAAGTAVVGTIPGAPGGAPGPKVTLGDLL